MPDLAGPRRDRHRSGEDPVEMVVGIWGLGEAGTLARVHSEHMTGSHKEPPATRERPADAMANEAGSPGLPKRERARVRPACPSTRRDTAQPHFP